MFSEVGGSKKCFRSQQWLEFGRTLGILRKARLQTCHCQGWNTLQLPTLMKKHTLIERKDKVWKDTYQMIIDIHLKNTSTPVARLPDMQYPQFVKPFISLVVIIPVESARVSSSSRSANCPTHISAEIVILQCLSPVKSTVVATKDSYSIVICHLVKKSESRSKSFSMTFNT